jgi:hypothetical protein
MEANTSSNNTHTLIGEICSFSTFNRNDNLSLETPFSFCGTVLLQVLRLSPCLSWTVLKEEEEELIHIP